MSLANTYRLSSKKDGPFEEHPDGKNLSTTAAKRLTSKSSSSVLHETTCDPTIGAQEFKREANWFMGQNFNNRNWLKVQGMVEKCSRISKSQKNFRRYAPNKNLYFFGVNKLLIMLRNLDIGGIGSFAEALQ
uniref:Uncharacterized protein n=1 Tax=Romanomermis culicivorax TaxID=13658 RepID=A0A915J788_ROMCU